MAPSDNSIVYTHELVGTTDGISIRISKSTDGGASWNVASPISSYVSCLVVDPYNPDKLYAGGYGIGSLRSTDGGVSWIMKNPWPESNVSGMAVDAIVIDPVNPDVIYVGGTGASKSTDGGLSWIPPRTNLFRAITTATAKPISPSGDREPESGSFCRAALRERIRAWNGVNRRIRRSLPTMMATAKPMPPYGGPVREPGICCRAALRAIMSSCRGAVPATCLYRPSPAF